MQGEFLAFSARPITRSGQGVVRARSKENSRSSVTGESCLCRCSRSADVNLTTRQPVRDQAARRHRVRGRPAGQKPCWRLPRHITATCILCMSWRLSMIELNDLQREWPGKRAWGFSRIIQRGPIHWRCADIAGAAGPAAGQRRSSGCASRRGATPSRKGGSDGAGANLGRRQPSSPSRHCPGPAACIASSPALPATAMACAAASRWADRSGASACRLRRQHIVAVFREVQRAARRRNGLAEPRGLVLLGASVASSNNDNPQGQKSGVLGGRSRDQERPDRRPDRRDGHEHGSNRGGGDDRRQRAGWWRARLPDRWRRRQLPPRKRKLTCSTRSSPSTTSAGSTRWAGWRSRRSSTSASRSTRASSWRSSGRPARARPR